jgi:hypothetical protein
MVKRRDVRLHGPIVFGGGEVANEEKSSEIPGYYAQKGETLASPNKLRSQLPVLLLAFIPDAIERSIPPRRNDLPRRDWSGQRWACGSNRR